MVTITILIIITNTIMIIIIFLYYNHHYYHNKYHYFQRQGLMAPSTRRVLLGSLISSIVFILLYMMYITGSSSQPLDDATYYASHADRVYGHIWRKIKARWDEIFLIKKIIGPMPRYNLSNILSRLCYDTWCINLFDTIKKWFKKEEEYFLVKCTHK